MQAAPYNVEELAEDIPRAEVSQVASAVNSLLAYRQIVKYEGRQGGPFFCLPDYVEEVTVTVRDELRRDYSEIYERSDTWIDL